MGHNVPAVDDGAKLFKADPVVAILVGVHDRLVDDLLQLIVLEVVANHHLEHNEKLAVRDVAIAIHVVHAEGKAKFFFVIAASAKDAQALEKG